MKYLYKIFIVLVYSMPIFLLGYLIMQNINPELNIEYSLDGKKRMAPELVPLSRLGDTGFDAFGMYIGIDKEPVYLDISIPRKYDKVAVDVEYSDLQVPVFEIGVSRNDARTAFDFISLENYTLEGLDWNKLEGNGLVLYQREKKYNNIDDFLFNHWTFGDTLVYRANSDPYITEKYNSGNTEIKFPIKKTLQVMVYHLGGKLKIEAEANKDYTLNIFKNNELVPNEEYNLFKGTYKVELIGDQETIFTNIKTNSPYVAIINGISFGKLDSPVRLYSLTSRLLFRTEEATGLQTIKIHKESIEIKESFIQYSKYFDNRLLKQIDIPNGDLEIGGTLFFINNWNLFYPIYEKFYSGINLDGINFILAKQTLPVIANSAPETAQSYDEGVVRTRKAIFDLENTPTPYNKIRFLLSLPTSNPSLSSSANSSLSSSAKAGDLVKIRGIKFNFTGEKMDLADIFYKVIKKIRDLKI